MKRMKRRISLLLAVLLAIQLTAAVPALAADPQITVTFLDAEGNPIGAGTYSYEGTEFDISKLDTYLTSLSSAELEALGKAAEVKLETSYTAPEGPEITAEDNAEGNPLTVKVNGSASKIKVAEGANVTFVGDFDAGNMTDAAVHTVGDATVKAEGDIVGHDHNLPENGILAENEVNSSGEEIPNKVDITFVGDVQGNPTGIQAEGNAHIDVDGSVFGVRNGIIADEHAVIETEGGEVRSIYTGIQANDDSSVTTEGNVIARGSGTKKDEYGNPVLDGNGNPVAEYYGNAVEAHDNAEVKITGDAEGNQNGIIASDSSSVEVNGTVIGRHGEFQEVTEEDGTVVKQTVQIGTGVVASGDAEVTVTENVMGASKGVQVADDATVVVEGNVLSPNGNGIESNNLSDSAGEVVTNTADVHVSENVSAYNDGIRVNGEAKIIVDGSVDGGHQETYTWTDADGNTQENTYPVGYGIIAEDNADIKVAQDVNGADDAIHAMDDSTILVEGSVYSDFGNGIAAENGMDSSGNEVQNEVQIKIQGDVIGYSDGINAEGDATISVEGSVNGGHQETYTWTDADGNTQENTYPVGYGIIAEDNAEIKVAQNVSGAAGAIQAMDEAIIQVEGTVSSDSGNGIIATNGEETTNGSEITVKGDVNAYANGIVAQGEAVVQVDQTITAGHEQTVQYIGFDGTEKEMTDYSGTGIMASDSATVTAGSVKASGTAVEASGNAEVTVHGNAESKTTGVVAIGDAVVEVDGTVQAVRTEEQSYTDMDGETVTYSYLVGQGISASNQAKVTAGEVQAGSIAINATGHADVQVLGNAESLNGEGIYTRNDGHYDAESGQYVTEMTDAKVHVTGDLTSANTAIQAMGESEIQVDGNVTSLNGKAIAASQESTVTVGKDVEGTTWNMDNMIAVIQVKDGADVTVDGSVHSKKGDAVWIDTEPVTNPETHEAEEPEENASITVGGDVTADDGAAIHMTSDADVIVMGDVKGGQLTETDDYGDLTPEEAAEDPWYQARKKAQAEAFSDLDVVEEKHGAVEIESMPEASGKLIISGTVSANGDDIPLVIKVSAGQDELPEEPVKLDLPEMKIYELAPSTDESYFDVDVTLGREYDYSIEMDGETTHIDDYANEHVALSEEKHDALVETIAAAIQYIIKVDPAYNNGAIKVADEFYDEENDLYAAHEGEEVSVTLSLDSSYELSASGNYTLKDNGNGSWTLTVQRGGGVTLTAVIRQQQIETIQPAEQIDGAREPEQSAGEREPEQIDGAREPEQSAGEREPEQIDGAREPEQIDGAREPEYPAVGKSVLFGRYDLDGDENPEELSWQILRVGGGYARLAMIAGFMELPEDFESAFNEWETEQIREGSLQPLDAGRTKELFGDGMVHPSMYVRFDALKLD